MLSDVILELRKLMKTRLKFLVTVVSDIVHCKSNLFVCGISYWLDALFSCHVEQMIVIHLAVQ